MAEHMMENDFLKVTVSDHGAELVSVLDKETGRERIWGADPKIWNRHAPLLFPFVGKVNQGTYRYNGTSYEMRTQHGFARDMEFTCVKESQRKVIHRLVSTPETEKIYPFAFTLYVTQELDEQNPRMLKISWEIFNEGQEKMYYAIGGHPGFAVPEGPEGKREDYLLEFPGQTEAEYILIDPHNGLAVPNNRYLLQTKQGFVRIDRHMFDRDALIFENCQLKEVRIVRGDRSLYVTLRCEQFPYVGIWSKPRGNFVCLEPWIGRTDNLGFEGELRDKEGEAVLDAGENAVYSYTIEFHK